MRNRLLAAGIAMTGIALAGGLSFRALSAREQVPYPIALAEEIAHYIFQSFTNPDFVSNAPVRYTLLGIAEGVPDTESRRTRFELPEGFRLSVFAEEIPHPRMMHLTDAGDLLVSQPRKGRILWLARDRDRDGRSDAQRVLIDGLNLPHGIEVIDGWLYVGELTRISRIAFDAKSGAVRGEPQRVIELPKTRMHNLRTLRLGPDGWLYFSVGADCNACEPLDPRQAALLRARPDGSDEEVWAHGFRNVVGFDWNPENHELVAVDVGRDFLGDDLPPEELNRIERGGFYGFPYFHGHGLPDPEIARPQSLEPSKLEEALAPVHTFGAHTTPLGLTFLRAQSHPADYRGAALVALHGSWNRTTKSGYRVVSLHWQPDGRVEQRDFIRGFEREEDVVGRPVDVVEGPDGTIYVSDDYAGAVYRVSHAASGG